jgi:hypothetical protein
MSFEEQCKLVYSIALNKFNDLAQTEDQNKNLDLVTLPRKIVRKEMLPDWFQEQQKKEALAEKESQAQDMYEMSSEDEIAKMKAILAFYT